MARVLFVCLHNAGRSQMSQALFDRAGAGRHTSESAGSIAEPGGRVHPEVVDVMKELGIDLSDRTPQRLTDDLAARADVLALSTVAGVSFDRAFPHTLRVTVDPERPVAVARQGADAYVLSERGRVIARVDRHAKPGLARMWVAKDVTLEKGAIVDGDLRVAVEAVTPLAGTHFPGRVVSLTTANDQLTLRLWTGLELRLGDIRDVNLKLAVAARVIPQLPDGAGYLDVSVPDRPVAGAASLDSQVEVEGTTYSRP